MASQDLVSAITRVSTAADGTQANDVSYEGASFSPDGTHVLFVSDASNLVQGDTNGINDLFLKDLTSGAVTRVNTAADGTQANSAGNFNNDFGAKFSPDGTNVLFASFASNLVPGDTNGTYDLFLKNLATGAIIRVNTAANGAQDNGSSNSFLSGATFSPDGTRVLIQSNASNLVPGDTNGINDLFLKDLTTGAITRISTAANGTQANGHSFYPAIFSPDGTRVLFQSSASNLVPGDTNGINDLFLKDLTTGAITRITTAADGTQANTYVDFRFIPSFSPDGTNVLFVSAATNLVPGDTNGSLDLFLKNLATGAITRVSTATDGTQANSASYLNVHSFDGADFSPDGTSVLFVSDASNLVSGDTNGQRDLFVKNLSTGAIIHVSSAADGTPGNNKSNSDRYQATFSPDGTRVLFRSDSSNLVPGDTSGGPDLFIKNLTSGAIIRVGTAADGTQLSSRHDFNGPTFSPDGNRALFTSTASLLVPGDTNGVADIFIKSLLPPATLLSVAAEESGRAEGNAGTTPIIFTVVRSGDTGGTTTVDWSVAGTGPNAASASDFQGGLLPSGTLAFAPGETTQQITIPVSADNAVEPDEAFSITLANPSAGTTLVTASAAATILNDDAADPAISLAITADAAARPEGNAGTTTFTFTVTRTGNLLGSASASWSVSGTGLRPADAADFAGGALPYGTVTFGNMETEKTITIFVAGDTAVETNEGFAITLSAPSTNVTLSPASATATITADDTIVDLAASAGGLAIPTTPSFYAGPVAGLEKEWISAAPGNTNVAVAGPNWFIHTGDGNDAIIVASGTNVLDGGAGSNFLTGGTGSDTFFLDARNPPSPIWSTVTNFGTGDRVTMWGINETDFAIDLVDELGAPGFLGLTVRATANGASPPPIASLTLSGYTKADLGTGGTLIQSFGFDSASNSHYLHIAHT